MFAIFFVACEEKSLHIKPISKPVVPINKSIQVVDYLDRTIRLNSPARRIVALSPHIVENLFSAELGKHIVATVDYADYPDAAKQIPRIGGFANFSLESIVRYEPDLVIGWGSGYAGFGQLLKKLEALSIPVYVDEPRELNDISRSIYDLAVLGGTEKKVKPLLKRFHQEIDILRQRYLNTNVEKIRLFYPIWHEPLQTLNGEHIVSDVIELCGAENIFSETLALAPQVNIESVLERDPQIIVASASGNIKPKWLNNWQQWPQITAVKNNALYFVSGDLLSRHTFRMVEGATQLCEYVSITRRKLIDGN